MKLKIRLLWSLEVIGTLLLLSGIALGISGAEVLTIPFPRLDLVPIAFAFCGVLLFVVAGAEIWYEKTKTKEQQIEEKDERLILIQQKAKARAFDLLAIVLPFILLALAMFGYMNKVSMFLLTGLYILCMGYYKFQLYKIKEEN
ncbi:hypothetical protein [Ornithinibacillus halophilus]|uniref:DUF2178 domain-containing protein n=1 Tax=Ornithinibacillus halophilus TaxID=930117 RepID=A0A1M5NQS7_9BACI|nr:hypothetical protein [Ornithinibacillus halophilus]SHG91795.1 hypothetical protein SAMN05216225_10873 [Ornithinibacillus halophilus]